MLALTVRTAHHILSAGAALVAPDERWYHTGPLSSGVIVLIDLVTDQPLACCSLFCLPAFLAWCNWQRPYWSGNYFTTWDGSGQGSRAGKPTCACRVLATWKWFCIDRAQLRKLNHTANTHPPSMGYPENIRKLQSSLGTWVNWSLFLFTLTTCSLVWAAIYWFISVLILDWSMQSRAQWRKKQCKPTKWSIRQESIVRPLIAWCLRKQFACPESLSLSGCSVFRRGDVSSIQTDGFSTDRHDVSDARQVGHQLGEKIAINGLLNQCVTLNVGAGWAGGAMAALSINSVDVPCNSSLKLIL